MTPTLFVRPVFKLRSTWFGLNPSALIALRTRRVHSLLTRTLPFRTAETVEGDTAASRATSRIVIFCGIRIRRFHGNSVGADFDPAAKQSQRFADRFTAARNWV